MLLNIIQFLFTERRLVNGSFLSERKERQKDKHETWGEWTATEEICRERERKKYPNFESHNKKDKCKKK